MSDSEQLAVSRQPPPEVVEHLDGLDRRVDDRAHAGLRLREVAIAREAVSASSRAAASAANAARVKLS